MRLWLRRMINRMCHKPQPKKEVKETQPNSRYSCNNLGQIVQHNIGSEDPPSPIKQQASVVDISQANARNLSMLGKS